jgi:hypothetical protein
MGKELYMEIIGRGLFVIVWFKVVIFFGYLLLPLMIACRTIRPDSDNREILLFRACWLPWLLHILVCVATIHLATPANPENWLYRLDILTGELGWISCGILFIGGIISQLCCYWTYIRAQEIA